MKKLKLDLRKSFTIKGLEKQIRCWAGYNELNKYSPSCTLNFMGASEIGVESLARFIFYKGAK